jgi:hypothetical protein
LIFISHVWYKSIPTDRSRRESIITEVTDFAGAPWVLGEIDSTCRDWATRPVPQPLWIGPAPADANTAHRRWKQAS